MLGLHCETNAAWIERVRTNASVLLADHAHCEKKAATMAISLLNRYPSRTALVEAMADLAIEEMSHFKMATRKLAERGLELERDPGDPYAQLLSEHIRKQEPDRFLDRLIVCSLIEARSCERFRLLSEHADDEDLRHFYASLLASEARHRNLFLKLARQYFPESVVEARLHHLQAAEATIVLSLPSEPTMHG
jgi:tRNA 2-(methylsulfanyl)-N6-isopentenyladenosine37 hydroxylase